MGLEPLASRVLRRSIVSNWANADDVHEPEALLDDMLEGKAAGVQLFREAVSLKHPTPYLSPSENHLVWSSLSEELQELRSRNLTVQELAKALGLTPWMWEIDGKVEEAIEIVYPISAVQSLYKPCAVHAGPNPLFVPADVKYRFGRTPEGLREMVHPPVEVVKVIDSGARFQPWEML